MGHSVQQKPRSIEGAGYRLLDPEFHGIASLVLSTLLVLPSTLRERLFFSEARLSLFLQKAVQRCLGGSRTVRCQFVDGPLTDYLFECSSSEKYFLMGSSFELEAQNTFRGLVVPGDVIYDVGAHIGYAALLFSVLCGPRGHVFAFEPSPANFSQLQRNVALNKRNNITILNVGASDVEGIATLESNGSRSSIIGACSAQEGGPSWQIRTVRLDDLAFEGKGASPDFVKIDIEGHAGPCLAGMESALENSLPKLVIELHHRQEAEAVRAVLDKHSYTAQPLGTPDRFPRRIVAIPR